MHHYTRGVGPVQGRAAKPAAKRDRGPL